MRTLIVTIFICLSTLYLKAQNPVLSGVITYERKENVHKMFEEQDNSWSEARLKQMPKYKVDLFQLNFNAHQTFYSILTEDENAAFSWFKVANTNSVKKDLDKQQYEAEKGIYEQNYRIKDSIPAYQWKMLGEYRTIAGYTCRKAATIIMDSIYVIAFYTDQIPVSSGPEAFSGLPGMIMGIVIPRMNLTYFATKVETQILPETAFVLKNSKSKVSSFASFNAELSKALKDWGQYASRVLWKGNL